MFKNKTLIPLALIMLINALSYGVIIPLLYPYAARFGLGALGLSLLLASYSIAQFFATPLIGRLADRYGRRPLLVISIFGTAISLVLLATANSVWMLIFARMLDGITGGNISVAQAVIADTTTDKERAKSFGILGASFGFGFLFGPAIGGVLGEFGLSYPFWFAAILGFIATAATVFFLPETLKVKRISKEPLFRLKPLVHALFDAQTGSLLMITLLTALGFNAWILGFQTFTTDTLQMSARDIGLLFSSAGLVSLFMQTVGIRVLMKYIPSKKVLLLGSLVFTTITMGLAFLTRSPLSFAILLFIQNFAVAPQNPVNAAILSERTKAEDQGGMLGINQSYMSLGQIIGPVLAGLIASRFNVPSVFLVSSGIFVLACLAGRQLFKPVTHKTDL